MMDKKNRLQQKIIQANIDYHAELAATYDQKQPHYLPENLARVEAIISDLAVRTGGNSLLDLGCGTGFIINIARKHFDRVVGVDITQAMLDRVDTSSGKVEVFLAQTEDLSLLDDNSFDVCTGYGFLHHLYDLAPTLREAYRCLRPGGYFYSDQDPNLHYWQLMYRLKGRSDLDGFVAREVRSVADMLEEFEDTELEAETIQYAEYQKGERGGLDPDLLVSNLKAIGFRSASVRYEWFLGQGKVLHQQSPEDAQVIETFLREALPATRAYFKYLAFHAQK
ncbi:MAG: class I SAM-dependent methyltransferase [Chloroflexota bacterium]